MNYLNLIRWKNLLIILLVLVLIKFVLFKSLGVAEVLSNFNFLLLVIATLCITAAGNVINDIIDIEADTINKPNKVYVGKSISKSRAYNLFMLLNIVGVGIGFYLSQIHENNSYLTIAVLVSGGLYLYSSHLKGIVIVGNIVVSLMIAITIIMETTDNASTQFEAFKIVSYYSLFAFTINLLREMVKDIEDVDGDYNADYTTLPILIGRERTTRIVFALTLVVTIGIILYTINILYNSQLLVGYFLLFVIAPMIYVCIKLFSAETKKDYKHISIILKLIMLTGLLSLGLYRFI